LKRGSKTTPERIRTQILALVKEYHHPSVFNTDRLALPIPLVNNHRIFKSSLAINWREIVSETAKTG